MNIRKAIGVSFCWVLAALAFNAGVYHYLGQQKALEFMTGYLVELSLSVDNIFIFLMIFKYFKCGHHDQTRILTWGIWGAQLMRAIFIIVGIKLITKFSWLLYVLGIFLVITGIKMFIEKSKDLHLEDSAIIRFFRKNFPGIKEWVIVLIVVELTDLIFAMDSIPAVFAVTKDPFIVWTSNVFAIIGLRAMYFALAGIMPMFTYLHYALGAILIFIGAGMLIEHVHPIATGFKLSFIFISLVIAVAMSMWKNKYNK